MNNIYYQIKIKTTPPKAFLFYIGNGRVSIPLGQTILLS